jgi:LysR family glycine cleavage system transcriptional activator
VSSWPLLGIASDRWPSWFKEFGGKPPARFVANFSDSETLIKAAVEGLGVALAPMTLARPMIEAGKLVPLAQECQRSEYAHYLVYPPRSDSCRGLRLFREWIVREAQAYSSTKDGRGGRVGRTASPALNRPTAGRR